MRDPGNRINRAKNIGELTQNRRFRNSLSPQDPRDFYQFSLGSSSRINLSLRKLKANANVALLNGNGDQIDISKRRGRKNERIRTNLGPGTYFINVFRRGGKTSYQLKLKSKPTEDSTPAPNPLPEPSPPVNLFQNLWGVYQGVGVTSIGMIDPLSGQLTSAQTFQTSIVAEVAAPRSAGGITESNPFSLSINSSPAEIAANVEGAISVNSALPFSFRGGFLLQYWNLQYSGNQLTGTLVNRDSGTALTTNLFNSTMNLGLGLTTPFPYAMDVGTTIEGTLTSNELRVRIQGFDSGRTRVFVSDVVAQRT